MSVVITVHCDDVSEMRQTVGVVIQTIKDGGTRSPH